MLINILKPDFEFKDVRGTLIQLVRMGYNQINVITSVSNSIRGGHYHKNNMEAFYIICGELELDVWEDGQAEIESYHFKTGDMFMIPSYVVHSFKFVHETTLVSMYSNGVELPDGSKDIIAVESEKKAEYKKIEPQSDGDANITTLLKEKNGQFQSISEQKILLNNKTDFQITFTVDIASNSKMRWYAVRSRKIKLLIDEILCVSDEGQQIVDLSSLFYHEGENTAEGLVDMITFDPCIDFTLPDFNINQLLIKGHWDTMASYEEVMNAYYKKMNMQQQQLNEEFQNRILKKDEEISKLNETLHKQGNELKAAYKKIEKCEIHVELLKQDIKKR